MRRFNSYGPIDTEEHYYAPREALIANTCTQLTGPNPQKGGHFITVWAPRQTGKTWLMQQVMRRLHEDERFSTLKINMERLKYEEDPVVVANSVAQKIGEGLGKQFGDIESQDQFQEIFRKRVLEKPLILILDEFDALPEEAINFLVSTFRNIYIDRMDESTIPARDKRYLLHAVALIGVRSVLGIENIKGSPFNVQLSLHIPNLTFEEVRDIFRWYSQDSGQDIESRVIDRLFEETRGQPGLTCWFGELMTEGFEGYQNDRSQPIGMNDFEKVYAAATYTLPNNNILNIISKARGQDVMPLVLEMFKTGQTIEFAFDEPTINTLYMNGIADKEEAPDNRYFLRFSCPFIQKRLFNYFSRDTFKHLGQLLEPFTDTEPAITPTRLDIREFMKLYQSYLDKNKSWLFKDVPRRADLRVYEAIFHFNLYSFMDEFLRNRGGRVIPEFPTGNGKIDLLIRYNNAIYGIELKSFTDQATFNKSLQQAARYGKHLEMEEIYLVNFVDFIDTENRELYEKDTFISDLSITVKPIFIQTGNP